MQFRLELSDGATPDPSRPRPDNKIAPAGFGRRTDNELNVNLGRRPKSAVMAYHAHGYAGLHAIGRVPDDYYSERSSTRDAETAGKRDLPSYIVGLWHIVRLTR